MIIKVYKENEIKGIQRWSTNYNVTKLFTELQQMVMDCGCLADDIKDMRGQSTPIV